MEMHRKIAVDGSLANIKKRLNEYGYEIDDLNMDNLEEVSAVITNGQHDMSTLQNMNAPVINAEGHSAEELKNMIESGLF
ncbi:YkuS family protein [Orenia marismortui]|uniref:Uncharacterized protein UPF0180 n=1 Tax=Orenia marismortui TaxID=46469 RepID=A0A4R8H452_9FIRM|nr:YkuS family protein [Orenia marismortui]TDX51530.1 uncharacterized protein UPF0180 [Orenia marismortui]